MLKGLKEHLKRAFMIRNLPEGGKVVNNQFLCYNNIYPIFSWQITQTAQT